MAYKTVIFEQAAGIAKMTLNRPEALNAMDSKMADELIEIVEKVRKDDSIKVFIITGTGRGFCTGRDLKEDPEIPPSLKNRLYLRYCQDIVNGIMNMEKPVIAAVNGVAAGAGCNIALCCDIVIASEAAAFSEIFVRVGLVPDLAGMFLLPRLVGLRKAKELVFSGKMVSAKEAEQMGLINLAVPPDKFESVVNDWAKQLASVSTKAVGYAKTIMNRAYESDLPTSMQMEEHAQGILCETEEHIKAVTAFIEKSRK